MYRIGSLLFALLAPCSVLAAEKAGGASPLSSGAESGFEYLDTGFENASPIWYDFAADGAIQVHLLYDHERSSPNRAAGHFHFRIHAKPGAKLTIEFRNLDNVWNGKIGSVAGELRVAVVSENGRDWKPIPLESLPQNRVRLPVEMPGPRLYVARLEPYRISDLDRLLKSIEKNPRVEIAPIGRTVEGRPLEIVRVGDPQSPHHVFLRARAHPWESGGNWVVEGLIRRLLSGDDAAKRHLHRYCLWVLPMANKDGVARGWTRFNVQGKDLNRDWDRPADAALAPENVAVEKWVEAMIAQGRGPDLAIDLHNDGSGLLHVSRPEARSPATDRYLARMQRLEKLLRENTWFTEGSTKGNFRNPGTIGEGLLARYGITACIHELNCNRIAGLNDFATGANWKKYGEQLALVFFKFFEMP
ncbi:MAG: M14 family zinc carboxypeptidase [Thermoguttaceae bacterium]